MQRKGWRICQENKSMIGKTISHYKYGKNSAMETFLKLLDQKLFLYVNLKDIDQLFIVWKWPMSIMIIFLNMRKSIPGSILYNQIQDLFDEKNGIGKIIKKN